MQVKFLFFCVNAQRFCRGGAPVPARYAKSGFYTEAKPIKSALRLIRRALCRSYPAVNIMLFYG